MKPNKKAGLTLERAPNRPQDTVIFIPRTPGGMMIRDTEQQLASISAFKIRIVEECEATLKDTLIKSNPWCPEDCRREGCALCKARRQGDDKLRGSYKTKSVTYQTSCMICKAQGREAVYVGESGRSLFERGREPIRNSMVESGKAKSHIMEHFETDHPCLEPGHNVEPQPHERQQEPEAQRTPPQHCMTPKIMPDPIPKTLSRDAFINLFIREPLKITHKPNRKGITSNQPQTKFSSIPITKYMNQK